MFRAAPLSIIRSYSLYTQRWYMSYRFVDSLWAESGWNCSSILSVQWITPDDGQRNCPKHVEFHFQNKSEKLVHLVGFIIKKTVECITRALNKVFSIASGVALHKTAVQIVPEGRCNMLTRSDVRCKIFIYYSWVSTRWQWSVNLCKNRKETAIYKRRNDTKNNTKAQNTQYRKQINQRRKQT
jgi:hypothetical protein